MHDQLVQPLPTKKGRKDHRRQHVFCPCEPVADMLDRHMMGKPLGYKVRFIEGCIVDKIGKDFPNLLRKYRQREEDAK